MTQRGYDCGQCGGQCDLCKDAERIDRIGRSDDPWAQPMYVPRWLYVLMLVGSMFTIGLLGWGWR